MNISPLTEEQAAELKIDDEVTLIKWEHDRMVGAIWGHVDTISVFIEGRIVMVANPWDQDTRVHWNNTLAHSHLYKGHHYDVSKLLR